MRFLRWLLVLALVLAPSVAWGGDGRLSPQGGTIVGVTAGTGLTGGGITGTVTLNVACGFGLTCLADSIAASGDMTGVNTVVGNLSYTETTYATFSGTTEVTPPATATTIRLDCANNYMSGITGGTSGRLLTLMNTSASTYCYLADDTNGNASATAANRFDFYWANMGGGLYYPLGPLTSVTVEYDGTALKWKVISNTGFMLGIESSSATINYLNSASVTTGAFGEVVSVEQPSPSSGTVNDWAPTNYNSTFFRVVPTGNLTITGKNSNGYNTKHECIWNASTSYTITLPHESTLSSPTHRFNTPTGADIVLQPHQIACFNYDASTDLRWFFESTTGGIVYTPSSGAGTTNYIPVWTPNGYTLGDSIMMQTSTAVGITTTTPGTINGTAFSSVGLHVKGTGSSRYIAVDDSAQTGILLNSSGQAADNRLWGFLNQSTNFSISTFTDAGIPTEQVRVTRAGNMTVAGTVTLSGTPGGSSASAAIFGGASWRMKQNGGDEANAGVLDYRGFDANALSIVGAGTASGSRLVRVFDNLTVSGYEQIKGTPTINNDVMTFGFTAPNGIIATKNSSGSPASNLYLQTTDTLGATSTALSVLYDGSLTLGRGPSVKIVNNVIYGLPSVDADAQNLGINYYGFNDGFTRSRDFSVYDGKGGNICYWTGATKTMDCNAITVGGTSVVLGGGNGSANYLPIWTNTNTLSVSKLYYDGSGTQFQYDATHYITISPKANHDEAITWTSTGALYFASYGGSYTRINSTGDIYSTVGGRWDGNMQFGDAAGDTVDVYGNLTRFGVAGGSGYVYVNGDEIDFHYGDNSTQTGYINYHGYNNGLTQFRNLWVGDGKATQICMFTGSNHTLDCNAMTVGGQPVVQTPNGTTNTIAKFTNTNVIGNSSVTDNGTTVQATVTANTGGFELTPTGAVTGSIANLWLDGVRTDVGTKFVALQLKPVMGAGYTSGLTLDTYNNAGSSLTQNIMSVAPLTLRTTFANTTGVLTGSSGVSDLATFFVESAGNTYLQIKANSGGGSEGGLLFGNSSGNADAGIISRSDRSLQIRNVGNTTRITVDTNGDTNVNYRLFTNKHANVLGSISSDHLINWAATNFYNGVAGRNLLHSTDDMWLTSSSCAESPGGWASCAFGTTISYTRTFGSSPRGVNEWYGVLQSNNASNLAWYGERIFLRETGIRDVRNRTFTFSIWAKAASGTPGLIMVGSRDPTADNFSTTCTLSTSWQRCTASGTFGNTAAADGDNSQMLIYMAPSATTTAISVWGAQFEESTAANAQAYVANRDTNINAVGAYGWTQYTATGQPLSTATFSPLLLAGNNIQNARAALGPWGVYSDIDLASGRSLAPIADTFEAGYLRKNAVKNSDAELTSSVGDTWAEAEYGATIVETTTTQVSPRGVSETVGQVTCTNGGTTCAGGGHDYRYTAHYISTGVSDVRGQTWTFSAWYKLASGVTYANITLAIGRYNDSDQGTGPSDCVINSTTWTRCWVTRRFNTTSLTDNSEIRAYQTFNTTTGVYVYGAQLEQSPEPTDYQKNDDTLATTYNAYATTQSAWGAELRAAGTMQNPKFSVDNTNGVTNMIGQAVGGGGLGTSWGATANVMDVFYSGFMRKNLSEWGHQVGTDVAADGNWRHTNGTATIVYATDSTQTSPFYGGAYTDTVGKITCTGATCTSGGAYHAYIATSATTSISDLRNKTITFSVWVKSASGTNTAFEIDLARYNDNEITGTTCTVNSATWTRCVYTKTFSNTSYTDNSELRARIVPQSTTAHYIAGAQIELGSYATPFEETDGTISSGGAAYDPAFGPSFYAYSTGVLGFDSNTGAWTNTFGVGNYPQHPAFYVNGSGDVYANSIYTTFSGIGAMYETVEYRTIVGSMNDMTINAATTTLYVTPSGAYTITGINPGSSASGRVLTVCNIGANDLTLAHENASSTTAADRFQMVANVDWTLHAWTTGQECVTLRWDVNAQSGVGRWRQTSTSGVYLPTLYITSGNTTVGHYFQIRDYDTDTVDGVTVGTQLISRDYTMQVWTSGLVVGGYSNGSTPAACTANGMLCVQSNATVYNNLTVGDATGDVLDMNGQLSKFGNTRDGLVYFFENEIDGEYATNADPQAVNTTTDANNATLYLNYSGYNHGATKYRDLYIGDGKGAQVALFHGADKSTYFRGKETIAIAATTASAAPAGTALELTQAAGSSLYITFRQTDATTGIEWANGSGSTDGAVLYNVSGTRGMALVTAGTVRQFIDSSGKVQMGTTSNTAYSGTTALEVGGDVLVTGALNGYTQITKASNQDVNNVQNSDDSALQFSVTSGKTYAVEFMIMYSGNDVNGDYEFRGAVSAGTMDGRGTCETVSTSDAASFVLIAAVANTVFTQTAVGTLGTDNTIPNVVKCQYSWKQNTSSGTFKIQYGVNTLSSGRIARNFAGSYLKWKQLD